jgi:hypothetical protein
MFQQSLLRLMLVIVAAPGAAAAGERSPVAETRGNDTTLAVTCAVPSQRPTIQSAIDDPICTTIQVSAGTYHEILAVTRSIIIIGTGPPILRGNIGVRGSGVVATVDNFQIQPYSDVIQRPLCSGIAVIQNATVYPDRVNIVGVAGSGVCLDARGDLIFADGFETGNTARL